MVLLDRDIQCVGRIAVEENLERIAIHEFDELGVSKAYDEDYLGLDDSLARHHDGKKPLKQVKFMYLIFDSKVEGELYPLGIAGVKEPELESYNGSLGDILRDWSRKEGAIALFPESKKAGMVLPYNYLKESAISSETNPQNYMNLIRSLPGRIFRSDFDPSNPKHMHLLEESFGTKMRVGMNLVNAPEEYGVRKMVQLKSCLHSKLGMSSVISYNVERRKVDENIANHEGKLDLLYFLRFQDMDMEVYEPGKWILPGIVGIHEQYQHGPDFIFRPIIKQMISREDLGLVTPRRAQEIYRDESSSVLPYAIAN